MFSFSATISLSANSPRSVNRTRPRKVNPCTWVVVTCFVAFALVFLLCLISGNLSPIDQPTDDPLLLYALQLNHSIDVRADPCTDFYRHACGNWVLQHHITDQAMHLDHGMLLIRATNQMLRAALEKAQKDSKFDSLAVRYLVQLYSECIDEKQREKVGLEPVRTLMQQIIGGDWPVLYGHRHGTLDDDQWMNLFVDFLMLGHSPVMSITIDMNPLVGNTKVIKISKSTTLKFGSPKKYKNVNLENKFFDIVKHLMSRVFPLFPNDQRQQKKVNKAIHQLIHFEGQLSKHATASTKQTMLMTVQSLKRHTDNLIDWTELLNRFASRANASKRFVDSDEILVSDLEYIRGMTSVLLATPFGVVKNFFAWMFVYNCQYLLDNATRQSWTNVHDSSRQLTTAKRCLNLLQKSQLFTLAFSQFYVLHYENKTALPLIKSKVSDLIADLKYAYEMKILDTEETWLNSSTQKKALIKLRTMRQLIGYTEWIRDATEVDRRYHMNGHHYNNTIQVVKGQFFTSYIQWVSWDLSVHFQSFQQNQSLHWFKQFNEINSYYQLKNVMFVPQGILQPPYFHLNYPAAINYASIGSILGHEIGHAFDFQGHNYDEHGNRTNWWSDYSKKQFIQRANCFKKQYSDITEPITGLKLNGTRCLSENMADNSGIRQAFNAWQLYLNRSASNHPYQLAFLTPEKLFFLAYAQVRVAL